MYRLMNRQILAITFLAQLAACEMSSSSKTPEMKEDARNTVLKYLAKNQLPAEVLAPFNSLVTPTPDFSYLYAGGGRCIEFIVYCHGKTCNDWSKYPYDEHGDECPFYRGKIIYFRYSCVATKINASYRRYEAI